MLITLWLADVVVLSFRVKTSLEILKLTCYYVEVEPVLQEITGEVFNRGASQAPLMMFASTPTPAASGKGKDLHSLMFGFVTQMQNLMRTSPQITIITVL